MDNKNSAAKKTEQSLERMSDMAKKRDAAILDLLLQTGIKSSELVQLNIRDIWRHDQLKNWLVIKKTSKSGKATERRIPLNEEAKKAIEVLLAYNQSQGFTMEPDSPFLVSRQQNKIDGSYRITSRQVQRIIKSLKDSFDNAEAITPQSLRHLYAERLIKNGTDFNELQKLLGHKSVKTTRDLYQSVKSDSQD